MLSVIEERALGTWTRKSNMSAEEKRKSVAETFANQVAYCRHNDAPITARVSEAIINVIDHDSEFGARVLDWAGDPILDALPLRCTAAFHALYLSGDTPELAGLYAGEDGAMANAENLIRAELSKHEARLLPWLDGPPQTNEAGRSSSFIAGLHWLAERATPEFELLEIGSSAGMNLLIDRIRYDLDGVVSGPEDGRICIRPEWRGSPPPANAFTINSVKGSDIAPIDVRDDTAASRLRAYIWPEAKERFVRLNAGIEMIAERGVDLVQADAADWVEKQLALPQAAGTCRTLMHSIVWQYLPAECQRRIHVAMAKAAEQATPDKPLAWLALETNRTTYRHELTLQYWPGGGEPVILGTAHAHGAWVEWLGL
jgi:hypothetical protein